MIAGTWTAFEALAGDLWEAALNANPQWGLLAGDALHIRTLAGDAQQPGEFARIVHEFEVALTDRVEGGHDGFAGGDFQCAVLLELVGHLIEIGQQSALCLLHRRQSDGGFESL